MVKDVYCKYVFWTTTENLNFYPQGAGQINVGISLE